MRELAVISGKGGTGKTSITASFAILADNAVIADCDVDASDLHLILSPSAVEEHVFSGGCEARIIEDQCTACGICAELCRFDAVQLSEGRYGSTFRIDPFACEGCGVCVQACDLRAIEFRPRVSGSWMVTETRCGPMVYARLIPGAENSGKLVTTVRREAVRIAETEQRSLILIDGPPGIGCPVIATLTGVTDILVITEPTVSGAHDLERVLSLANHFDIPAHVCINKWDLNPAATQAIENKAMAAGAGLAGRIRYDSGVIDALVNGKAIVETGTAAVEDILNVWDKLAVNLNRELAEQRENEGENRNSSR